MYKRSKTEVAIKALKCAKKKVLLFKGNDNCVPLVKVACEALKASGFEWHKETLESAYKSNRLMQDNCILLARIQQSKLNLDNFEST